MKALVAVAAVLPALAAACSCDGGGPPGPETDPCSGNLFTPAPLGEGSPSVDPAATPAQTSVGEYVNQFRTTAGAPPIDLSPEIDVAATAHATYFVTNPAPYAAGLSPHDEDPAYPNGFTGVNFWDRLGAAGYPNAPSFEVMHFIDSPLAAVDDWVNSVYHRSPFLSPTILDLGYGGATGAGSADVIDFGCCASAASDVTVLFPYHDQTGYPTSFSGAEGPPPPSPPNGWPSGSMISISFNPDATWTIGAHALYEAESCDPVDHLVSAGPDAYPGFLQDFLGGMFLIYAERPLAPSTSYTVNVEGTLGGVPFVRTWRFTTAP